MDWNRIITVYHERKLTKQVSIFEMPDKGNYYIIPYVSDILQLFYSLPVITLKISETTDEDLFDAALDTMRYCRKITFEELEETEIANCCEEEAIFDKVGFKKMTGFGFNTLQKSSHVTLREVDNQYKLFMCYGQYSCFGTLVLDMGAEKSEKAKFLRDGLNKSASHKNTL